MVYFRDTFQLVQQGKLYKFSIRNKSGAPAPRSLRASYAYGPCLELRLWRPWTQIQADNDNHSCRAIAPCGLNIVSILCMPTVSLVTRGIIYDLRLYMHAVLLSSKSLSISIAFLAAPRAVELTVLTKSFASLLFSGLFGSNMPRPRYYNILKARV